MLICLLLFFVTATPRTTKRFLQNSSIHDLKGHLNSGVLSFYQIGSYLRRVSICPCLPLALMLQGRIEILSYCELLERCGTVLRKPPFVRQVLFPGLAVNVGAAALCLCSALSIQPAAAAAVARGIYPHRREEVCVKAFNHESYDLRPCPACTRGGQPANKRKQQEAESPPLGR